VRGFAGYVRPAKRRLTLELRRAELASNRKRLKPHLEPTPIPPELAENRHLFCTSKANQIPNKALLRYVTGPVSAPPLKAKGPTEAGP